MSSLKPFYFVLIFLIGLSACSGDGGAASGKEGKTEQLPKVDKSKFHQVSGEGFSIQLLKEMSWNEVSGLELLDADLLQKEYHLKVVAFPISMFQKDTNFPADSEKQLEWFAREECIGLKARLLNSEAGELIGTFVGKRTCFKQNIHGKEYGFPFRKTFFMRYYKTEDAFINIIAWTTSDNANEFERLAQYMGMSFKAK